MTAFPHYGTKKPEIALKKMFDAVDILQSDITAANKIIKSSVVDGSYTQKGALETIRSLLAQLDNTSKECGLIINDSLRCLNSPQQYYPETSPYLTKDEHEAFLKRLADAPFEMFGNIYTLHRRMVIAMKFIALHVANGTYTPELAHRTLQSLSKQLDDTVVNPLQR